MKEKLDNLLLELYNYVDTQLNYDISLRNRNTMTTIISFSPR